MSRSRLRLLLLVLLVPAAAGCWSPRNPSIGQLDRGLVWIFPGVEGGAYTTEQPYRAFRAAGVDQAIRIHDWWRPFGLFVNLMAYERNRADAKRIAGEVADYIREHPGRPVDFVGYSGGGALAIWVTEALPDEETVRNIVLVQAALAPDYDLQPALRKIRGKLVSFHSPYDWWTLGLGTSAFGTMERRNLPACGKDGFDVPKAIPDPELRGRFEQCGWDRDSWRAGHWGNHASIIGYEWNKRFVAPWLLHSASFDQQR